MSRDSYGRNDAKCENYYIVHCFQFDAINFDLNQTKSAARLFNGGAASGLALGRSWYWAACGAVEKVEIPTAARNALRRAASE